MSVVSVCRDLNSPVHPKKVNCRCNNSDNHLYKSTGLDMISTVSSKPSPIIISKNSVSKDSSATSISLVEPDSNKLSFVSSCDDSMPAKLLSRTSDYAIPELPESPISRFSIRPNPVATEELTLQATAVDREQPPNGNDLLKEADLEALQRRYKYRRCLLPCLFDLYEGRRTRQPVEPAPSAVAKRPSDSSSELDLVDVELETAHRNVMARTDQKYLLVDVTSFADKFITVVLVALTVSAILALFWYQNFGPGIKLSKSY